VTPLEIIRQAQSGTLIDEDGHVVTLELLPGLSRTELQDFVGQVPRRIHEERPRVRKVVDTILAEHPEELKITPGKMVYEIQPKIEWDKGRAMLYLLETLKLDRDDVVPLYLGDDVTDENAFETLAERGVGIFVGSPDDPEVAGRTTAADYILHSTEEVRQFLDTLAR
jgi:trehalose 6-phosphate phosphatase